MAERARETFLGLDIGTSSVKALLVDAGQRVIAEASAPLSVSRPHPLWSEQDPSDWVEGVEAAVAAIRRARAVRLRRIVRDRPLGPDAWRDAARRAGQAAETRDSCGTTGGRSPNAPSSSAAFLISKSAPAISPCRASPRRKCCGSRRTSPRSPRRRSACCCRRTMCACGSRARRCPRCPTPQARSGSMSGGGAGTMRCLRRPA